MTDTQEFSEQEVYDIISAALSSLESSSVVPLSLNDSTLLEKLYHLLPKYVGTYSDAAYIISCLREELYNNVSHLSAQQLHTITKNCTKCSGATSKAAVPLWNVADPDIVLVLDNPSVLDVPANIDILVRSLKESGFTSQRVACTYATRCPFPPKTVGPQDYANCSHYLYAELHAWKPKLTVAFGSAVYGILTGDKNAKMKDIKGSVIWFGSFPVMPTYTLGYISHMGDDVSSAISYLEQDLSKAHAFCYGDKL